MAILSTSSPYEEYAQVYCREGAEPREGAVVGVELGLERDYSVVRYKKLVEWEMERKLEGEKVYEQGYEALLKEAEEEGE